MNIRDLSREVPEYTLPYTIWYSIRNSRQEASGFHFESDVCVRLPIDPLRVSQVFTGNALISLVKSGVGCVATSSGTPRTKTVTGMDAALAGKPRTRDWKEGYVQ